MTIFRKLFSQEAYERLEKENVALHNALVLIEMETRDGGVWGLRDVNEAARMALAGELK